MLVAETGPGQDQRGKSGIGNVDCDAGPYEFGFPGRQRQRGVQAGTQVEARGAGRRIRGKVRADAFIQNPECYHGLGHWVVFRGLNQRFCSR